MAIWFAQATDLAALILDVALGRLVGAGDVLKIVLFPDPFGPMSPRISPRSTENDTLFTAVKPPNRFVSVSTLRMVSAMSRCPR